MNLDVPVAELQQSKLFIATPMYGGQCFGSYTKCVLELSRLCQSYGIQAQFSFLFNESLITRARNYMVDEFLRSDSTHLMFIDSDIDFDPRDVLALLAMKKPIIGGPYPKKCIAWENIYDAVRFGMVPNEARHRLSEYAGDFVFNSVPGTKEIQLNQPAEVLEIGTGFMLVERDVFVKFAEAYPQYWYTPDHNRSVQFDGTRKIFQYFQAEIEPEHNRYLSEDYWFCQKARQIGISVWLAPWMAVKHHGTYIYSGSIPSMAAVINERIKRNERMPQAAIMDGAVKVDSSAPEITVKHIHSLSASKRKAFFNAYALEHKLDVLKLVDFYKLKRDEWMSTAQDSPIDECLKTFQPEGS
jgi:hypothetical protein